MRWNWLLGLGLVLLPIQFVVADSVTSFDDPLQFDAGLNPYSVNNGEYKRYPYPYYGGYLYIGSYKDSQQTLNPVHGETWIVAIDDPQTGARLGAYTFVYDEPSDCILYQGAPFSCDIRIPDGETGIKSVRITTAFGTQCLPVSSYELVVERQVPGGSWSPVNASPYSFEPTRFHPGPPLIAAPETLSPELPRDNFSPNYPLPPTPAQNGNFNVLAIDDLGCNVGIDGAEVSIVGTIVPETGGHSHFTSASEPADGFFWDYDETEPPASPRVPTYEGVSDEDGLVRLWYTPRQMGTTERFEVTSSVPPTSDEPGYSESSIHDIDIAVPGLVYLPPGTGTNFIYVDGGGCPHPVNNAPNSTHGHYFTSTMRDRVVELAELYNTYTGRNLSFNDGTLPYGGRFENEGGNGRTSECHQSHRQGIDIDINGPDANGHDLRNENETVVYNGTTLTLMDFVVVIADEAGLEKIPEGYSIHFRRIP